MSWRIKDWNKIYENNRTRALKKLDWVPIPNKMDGDGYTQLLDHPNGAAHFAVWIALVEIASRCEKRGILHRPSIKAQEGAGLVQESAGSVPESDDEGVTNRQEGAMRWHDPASLSRMSRIPAQFFQEAIPRLIEVGWIEEVTIREMKQMQEGAGLVQESAGSVPESDDEGVTNRQEGAEKCGTSAALARGRRTERNGTETKGRETNGTEAGATDEFSTSGLSGANGLENRSFVPPIEIPSKPLEPVRGSPGRQPANGALTIERVDRMRAELWGYMTRDDGTFAPKPPDDSIVLQCLNAIGPTSMETVHAVLRKLRNSGDQGPGHANGPRGYAWFLPVLTAQFGKQGEQA